MPARIVILAGLLATLVAPAAAHANGDPASDVLLEAKIYFPNQKVSTKAAKDLHAVVDKANAKGYAIRVALIKDPTDLGTVPQLLGQALRYAEFLGPEIRFAYKGDLLVVMPSGLAVTTTDETEPPTGVVQGIKVESGGSSDGLAETATIAVRALASAAGHPLDAKKKGGGSGAIVAVVVALGLILLAALAGLWLRRSNASSAP